MIDLQTMSFNLIISKTNHIALTLIRIPQSSDIDISVILQTRLSFMLHLRLI